MSHPQFCLVLKEGEKYLEKADGLVAAIVIARLVKQSLQLLVRECAVLDLVLK
jgi:hypothetical protein